MVKTSVKCTNLNLDEISFFDTTEYSSDVIREKLKARRSTILSQDEVLEGSDGLIKLGKDNDYIYFYQDKSGISPYSQFQFYDRSGRLIMTYPWNGDYSKLGKFLRCSRIMYGTSYGGRPVETIVEMEFEYPEFGILDVTMQILEKSLFFRSATGDYLGRTYPERKEVKKEYIISDRDQIVEAHMLGL